MLAGVFRIRPGVAGTYQTVAYLQRLGRYRALDPMVRAAAVSAVRFAPGHHKSTQARLLRDWIGERCQYLPDPTYAEAVHDPVAMLAMIARHGIIRVDCDDVAVLAAAMGLAIGLQGRYQIVGFAPHRHYAHIWAEYQTPGGWVPVDPTRPFQPPDIRRSFTVPF